MERILDRMGVYGPGVVVRNVSVGCDEKEIRGTISNLFVSLCEEFNE